MTLKNSLTKQVGTSLTIDLQKRNITEEIFNTIKKVTFPDVQDDNIILLAFDYAKAKGYDLIKSKPFHIVTIKGKTSFWSSIDSLRITAMRTGEYAGIDEVKQGEMITRRIKGKEYKVPEWLQYTVYRVIKGGHCVPFVGKKIYFDEAYKTKFDGTLTDMWDKMPISQLDKVAEAAALRRAFPEEIGNDYILEEAPMNNEPVQLMDVIEPETPIESNGEEIENQEDIIDVETIKSDEIPDELKPAEDDDDCLANFG